MWQIVSAGERARVHSRTISGATSVDEGAHVFNGKKERFEYNIEL